MRLDKVCVCGGGDVVERGGEISCMADNKGTTMHNHSPTL